MGTETGELDHEDSVGSWPLFPRRKLESGRGSEKKRTYGARGSAVEQEDEDGGKWTGGGRSELSREESVNLPLFR